MELRIIKNMDDKNIKRVFVDAFSCSPWNDDWHDEDQLKRYLKCYSDNPSSLSFGLYDNGILVGICFGRYRYFYSGTQYWIEDFAILPSMQGNGYGKIFLAMIEKEFKKEEVTSIHLLTQSRIPAYFFYSQNGFVQDEKTVEFYKKI